MRNIVVFSGRSHQGLSKIIVDRLGIEAGVVHLGKFSNGETSVEVKQNVRGKDVFVIQSGCGAINDNLMEMLIVISACKIASAKRIVAVIPCFPYAKQADVPYKSHGKYDMWQARPGTLVANLLMAAGVGHVITLDLHDPQFQGFFNIPVDNLFSEPLIIRYIQDNIPDYKKAVIVSPDSGGAKRATSIAEKMALEFGLVHREKKRDGDIIFVGDATDKIAIIIDDLVDTGQTLVQAAQTLKDKGAVRIYAIVTHGVLSGKAAEEIYKSKIDELIVSNSVPHDQHFDVCPKLKEFNIAPLFAEAIRRIHNGESVSFLFDHVPYS